MEQTQKPNIPKNQQPTFHKTTLFGLQTKGQIFAQSDKRTWLLLRRDVFLVSWFFSGCNKRGRTKGGRIKGYEKVMNKSFFVTALFFTFLVVQW